MVYECNIIQNNRDCYFTNKLDLVVTIVAENNKEYKLAVNPYDNELPEFKLHRENNFEQPIQVYLSMEEANFNHLKI